MDENQGKNTESQTTNSGRSREVTRQKNIQNIEQDINTSGTTDFELILSTSTPT